MTYRLVTQRARIARAALAVALLALTGVSAWVGVSRATSGQGGAPALLIAGLLPLATAGLLFVRPRLGAGLAVVAALVGAVSGIPLSFCLCGAPLSDSSIALLVASGVVLAVGIVTLLVLGMTWVLIASPWSLSSSSSRAIRSSCWPGSSWSVASPGSSSDDVALPPNRPRPERLTDDRCLTDTSLRADKRAGFYRWGSQSGACSRLQSARSSPWR